MRPWRRCVALVAALLLVVAADGVAAPDRSTGSEADFATELLTLINDYRASHGVPPLELAPPFTLLSTQHSEAMLAGGFYGHDVPGGPTFDQRVGGFVRAEGYRTWVIAENIMSAQGTPDPAAVLRAWMDSPPHDANLLDPRLHSIGIGTGFVEAGTGFWAGQANVVAITAIFGPPQPKLRESALVTAVRGTILVRLPGERTLRPVKATELLPAGSEVDAVRGRVRLTSAADAEGNVQTADFYEGRFVLGYADDFPGQTPRGVVTNLRLTGPLSCPPARKRSSRSLAATDARKPPPKARRLWGNGKGTFRTTAKFASATVRGTIWLTEDTCSSTLVRVREGRLDVYDPRRRKHVLVPAGKSLVVKR